MDKPDRPIPRWQQGFASFAFADVQARMTPRERRSAFIGDLLLGFGIPFTAAGIATLLGKMSATDFRQLIGFMIVFLLILFAANRKPFPESNRE